MLGFQGRTVKLMSSWGGSIGRAVPRRSGVSPADRPGPLLRPLLSLRQVSGGPLAGRGDPVPRPLEYRLKSGQPARATSLIDARHILDRVRDQPPLLVPVQLSAVPLRPALEEGDP